MNILYCEFAWHSGADKGQASMISDICPPALPRLISLKPLPPIPNNIQLLSTSSAFLSLSPYLVSVRHCFVSLCLWNCPPSLLQACMSNRPVKRRGGLLLGPPGVVSDAEAVAVALCIQWKEQGQWGVDCISWAFLNKNPPFFPPPPPHFHDDPWNALRGCRNSRWLAGGAPNTSFLFLSPLCLSSQVLFVLFLPKTGLRGTFHRKASWTVLYLFMLRPHRSCMFRKTMQVETLTHPPHSSGFLKEKAPQQCCSSWKDGASQKGGWVERKREREREGERERERERSQCLVYVWW